MPSRVISGVLALATGAFVAGCEKDQLKGPQAEVKPHNEKLDMPSVPSFDLPPPPADGEHSIKELRVKGKKFLDQEVTIKGYVTWAYDCPTAIRKEGESEADVQKRIDDDQQLCERPKFYLGDTPDTPPDHSMWVVDVPRPPSKKEVKNLPKEEIQNWPAVPPYKVGDQIEVTGKFVLSSPHSERNSEGLVVYEKLTNSSTTPPWTTPPPNPLAPEAPPAPTKQAPPH